MRRSIKGTVALVIAITGHRDLFPADEPQLYEDIRQILLEEMTRYSSTPVLLLSGLAEGADRVAVRAAISLGISYMAVLPLEPDLYREDFSPRSGVEVR
jgi:hypothetical protein